MFAVSFFLLSLFSRNTISSIDRRLPLIHLQQLGFRAPHLHHLRLASLDRQRHRGQLRPDEARRGRAELPRDWEKGHEVQRHDAKDEGRSGELCMFSHHFGDFLPLFFLGRIYFAFLPASVHS